MMALARQTELERTWPLGVYHVPLWLAAVLLLVAVRTQLHICMPFTRTP